MKNKILNFLILLILSKITIFAVDVEVTGTIKTAYFLDAPISGVQYQCDNGGILKTTGSNGIFSYDNSCANITFSLTNNDKIIRLGTISVSKIPSDYKLYITDFVGSNRTDTLSAYVKNLARLLQSLDNDENPKNGIEILNNNINISLSITSETSQETLQDIITLQYPGRTLISEICALVHLEEVLRDDGFYVDTTPPCKPRLAMDINATANDYTYIELIGERYSKIFLNGVDTNKTLNKNGRYYEFQLNTPIQRGTFDNFSITFKDNHSTTHESEPLNLRILNDTDQPIFVETNISIIAPEKVVTINASDDSVTLGGLTLEYEILGGVDQNLFTINSDGKVEFKNNSTPGTYQVQIKVKDKANHYDIKDLNITVN